MSTAHDHTLRALTEEEIADDRRADEGRARKWYSTCKRPKCTEPSRWLATWKHVTGQRGRIGKKGMKLCDRHAEQFRERHSPSGASPSGVIPQQPVATSVADDELL